MFHKAQRILKGLPALGDCVKRPPKRAKEKNDASNGPKRMNLEQSQAFNANQKSSKAVLRGSLLSN